MILLRKIYNWRILRALKKHPVNYSSWTQIRKFSCIRYLSSVEKARLRTLTSVLLKQKVFVGVQGLMLTNEMKLIIASQACVPILKLGLNYYSGFIQITVYPSAFWVKRNVIDEAGVVHAQKVLLSGESWTRGPVILSWQDIEHDMLHDDKGHNVIIHEFCHKIDMLNRGANGTPPIPGRNNEADWNNIFNDAYERLLTQVHTQQRTSINAYAAQSPVEFFAVASEYFFTAPELLQHKFHQVYDELALFYQQNPVKRLINFNNK
ncbi:MAG: zinc-dependent peptidase [Gammaproteobacteria bacterium]|nr:zinc-dependent peptidase [Gammaproteobacteria bacterium]